MNYLILLIETPKNVFLPDATVTIYVYTDTDISYLLLAPILYSVPLENNNAKK